MGMTLDERIHALAMRVQTPGKDWTVTGPIWNTIGMWSRYLGFLRIVLGRYEAANGVWMHFAQRWQKRMREEAGGASRPLAQDEIEELAAQHEAGQELHLEIESFYQFAKILLDRVADVILLYFGYPRPKVGSSHSRLVTGQFTRLCEEALPLEGRTLKPLMDDLHTRIVRHETDVIEHLNNPKLTPGTSYGAAGRAGISMGMVAPGPGDDTFPSTEDPAVLFKAIEGYMEAVVDFLECNMDKSVLMRTAP